MMKIRMVLFYLVLALTAPFCFIFGLLFFFAPFKFRYYVVTAFSYIYIYAAKYICGLSFKVEGRKNLTKRNAIVLCNHQSGWETLFMQTLLPPQSWVLKRELLSIPVFGWGLKLLEPIAIDRSQIQSVNALISQGQALLVKGRWIVIFPEGTRVKAGTLGRFTRSGAALAESTKAPVIPIAHNAGAFWPKGLWIKKSGTITVRIGPAIDTRNKTASEITDLARSWIEAHLP